MQVLAQRDIRIRDDHALGTALGDGQRKIASHFSTCTYTTPAQDTAVVIQNKIRVGGIDREVVPTWLEGQWVISLW